MHQPLEPIIDQSSTSSDLVGGLLTNDPNSLIPAKQSSTTTDLDTAADLPYKFYVYNIPTTVYGERIFSYDPFVTLLTNPGATGEFQARHQPAAMLPIRSCYFYDFDLEITFVAIKHERGRGSMMITWIPGSDGRLATTPPVNVRNQKWLWDIEANEQFKICLTGMKHTVWRSRFPTNRQLDFDRPTGYAYISDNLQEDVTASAGRLSMHVIAPYNAANVGPTDLSIIQFNRLVNLRTREYISPYGLASFDMTSVFAAPTTFTPF